MEVGSDVDEVEITAIMVLCNSLPSQLHLYQIAVAVPISEALTLVTNLMVDITGESSAGTDHLALHLLLPRPHLLHAAQSDPMVTTPLT